MTPPVPHLRDDADHARPLCYKSGVDPRDLYWSVAGVYQAATIRGGNVDPCETCLAAFASLPLSAMLPRILSSANPETEAVLVRRALAYAGRDLA